MFKEVLQIIPKMSSSDLSKMERLLNSRFAKVAKGFGKGIVGLMKGAGILGIASSLIDKLLNPLKEVQESIDRTLNQADDVVTNAEQFGSTPGELFKLQKLAQAKGLEGDALNQMLVKFQSAVAEAAADPTKQTSVRAFANDENMVQSFFEFIQQLNKMDRKQQVIVQNEVFGEKATLKMAEFLRADFAELTKQTGLKAAASYDPGLNSMASLNDLAANLKVRREANDVETKSRIINTGMITARDNAEKIELQRENERIANFRNLQSLSDTTNKISGLVEKGVFMVGDFIATVTPKINSLVDRVDGFAKKFGSWSLFGGKDK
jgi:hypothetical protein